MAGVQWKSPLLTAPSSFAELPRHLSKDHQNFPRQYSSDKVNYTYPESLDLSNTPQGADRGGLNSKLFEFAIAGMYQDQEEYLIQEATSRMRKYVVAPLTGVGPEGVMKRTTARDLKAPQAAKIRRPPSLAASHPAMYNGQPKQHSKTNKTMLPTPPPENHQAVFKVRHAVHDNLVEQKPVLPWQVYTDPKRLISPEPRFDDPKYRMLKFDTNPDKPSVVSPTFMIGLPCGTLIEAANHYGDDSTQTSNAPLK